ncbi:MAG: c-type cytochrome [Chitinophagaceae bacterium]|nr:c-type cytochrome [Chitinophagaceae bacterium]
MSSFIEKEKKARKVAIWIIIGMIGIWIVLSIFSFTGSEVRKRPNTENISFNNQSALKGKQVFQAYNGMDCHTIVGNGAYFAPDLTKVYEKTGAAWLKAYLGSPGTYPTQAIVNVNFQQLKNDGEIDDANFDAYLEKYEGAKERIDRRAGVKALMPNLNFSGEEIDALIAFFKYSAQLNTAGWPPEVKARQSVIDDEADKLEKESGLIRSFSSASKPAGQQGNELNTNASPAVSGQQLTIDLGCAACHSTDGSKLIGPSFKGLYGSQVSLDNGNTVAADDAYLIKSILDPNADIVKGYPTGVMPSFKGMVTDEHITDIITYLKTLK